MAWMDRSIKCRCSNHTDNEINIGGIFLGSVIRLIIISMLIMVCILTFWEQSYALAWGVLIAIFLLLCRDGLSYQRHRRLLVLNGHDKFCARRLALAEVIWSGPVL